MKKKDLEHRIVIRVGRKPRLGKRHVEWVACERVIEVMFG